MAKYERLGTFLLFEKVEEDKLSKNFLAGRIVDNQIQDFTVLKRFDHALSTTPDFIVDLNQEYQLLKELANPSIIKPSGLLQEKSDFAAVFDYMEGKSLRAVLNKCSHEGYPFTAEHALLIGSRVCSALEYIHSKKTNGQRLVHGAVCPETIFISYDGETKLQYLGLAHTLMKFTAGREKLAHDQKKYLAPEVLQHPHLDRAADIYATGVVLYEMLSGEQLYAGGREVSVPQLIEQGHMYGNSGEKAPFSSEIKRILLTALASDPAQRYATAADMRKDLDQVLFNSEYAPTTFNLAFFMNSLFRESIEEENKNLDDFRKLDVKSVVKEESAKQERPGGAEASKDMPIVPLSGEYDPAPGLLDLGSGEPSARPRMFLLIGIGVAAVVGVVAFLFFKPAAEKPTPVAQIQTPAVTAVSVAERQRLQEEAQKAQEEARKKDEALQELQSKLDELLKAQAKQAKEKEAAKASTVDAAAIRQLQEQARLLEEEKKRQEALAAEKLKAAQTPPAPVTADSQAVAEQRGPSAQEEKPQQIAAMTPPPTQPAAASSQQMNSGAANTGQSSETPQQAKPLQQQQPSAAVSQPQQQTPPPSAVKEGDMVTLTPDVVKPELVSRANPAYPPAALAKKVEGTVILSILVSETGSVTDVKVLREAGGPAGLNEAAMSAARKWKFRPAVKEGKKVKVWVTYPIVFKVGK